MRKLRDLDTREFRSALAFVDFDYQTRIRLRSVGDRSRSHMLCLPIRNSVVAVTTRISAKCFRPNLCASTRTLFTSI